MANLAQQARELSALAHIERNGNLLFWDGSAYEAERMFKTLAESQRIERNEWTGEWKVVPYSETETICQKFLSPDLLTLTHVSYAGKLQTFAHTDRTARVFASDAA